jgi:hypothetical protein
MKTQLNLGYSLIWLPVLLIIISCTKSTSYNSNVTIAANYNTQPVSQAKIYFRPGTRSAVPLTPAQYQEILTADGSGHATFYQLSPGSYYFFATGFSPQAGRTVQGDTVITVLARYRAESDFTILLNVK